jgi:hypothetical protein
MADQRDAIKHPEKMGPLGDRPDHPQKVTPNHAPRRIEEDARVADREQLTTQE